MRADKQNEHLGTKQSPWTDKAHIKDASAKRKIQESREEQRKSLNRAGLSNAPSANTSHRGLTQKVQHCMHASLSARHSLLVSNLPFFVIVGSVFATLVTYLQ